MTRTVVKSVVAGLIAIAALAAPAQAWHKTHGHHVKFHHNVHKFHAYRPVHVYHVPVCVKHEWTYDYGHKKLVCILWK